MSDRLAIVVLGAHRSGTSIMTRVISLCGFTLPRNLMAAQPDNAEGFWESTAIIHFNDRLMNSRDFMWSDVFPPDDAAFMSPTGENHLQEAVQVLASEFEHAPFIVLKDPRISVLTSFWAAALERGGYRSAYVLMVRHPMEVAASLSRRNGLCRDRGLLIWLSHTLSAERKTRGAPRVFVTYDHLLSDFRGVLDKVEAAIGEPLPRRTKLTELEVERALNNDLRHHRLEPAEHRRGELECMVADVHEWLLASARGDHPDPAILDRVTAQLTTCEQVIGGVLAEGVAETRRLAGALDEVRLQLDATTSQLSALDSRLEAEHRRVEQMTRELANAEAISRQSASALQAAYQAEHEKSERLARAVQIEHTNAESARLHVKDITDTLEHFRSRAEEATNTLKYLQSRPLWRLANRLKRMQLAVFGMAAKKG
jgi:hypothetical protein